MAIRNLNHPAELPSSDMNPGTRLRRSRERLGLTYRDVERASYELACQRGRPDFIVHLSRLADIENRDVTPSIYKLYSLAAIYHLEPHVVCQWYDVPFEDYFSDSSRLIAPNTHLAAAPSKLRLPIRFDPAFDPKLRQVKNTGWTNEYERPVYFIELHGEFRCCWCQCEGGKLILIPHPLSSFAPEVYRHPEEAEIVGQVVGVAMRLGPS